jgi:hypothetical protein
MKTKICILGFLLTISLPAWASLYGFGTLTPGGGSAIGAIPDNNTIGLTESYTVGGLGTKITDLTLTVVLQGGASTDLTGYLRLGNTVGSPSYDLTSLIQATPESGATTYSINFTTPGFQTAFNTQNPNNTWTLFFADTVPGDTTTLNGWSLGATAIPEPANVALGVFGGLAAVFCFGRYFVRKTKTA